MKKQRLSLRSIAMIFACLIVVVTFFSCKKNSDKQITAFSFATLKAVGVINEEAKTIVVEVPTGTDVKVLIPTITVSEKATVSPSSGVKQDFTQPVSYTVKAEDGSTINYTVTVTVGIGSGGGDDGKGVLINGIRWAICNVDNPGFFVKNPENAGMFYQWNRKVAWSNTNPVVSSDGDKTWNNSNPGGTEWEKTNDPSPVGYRVPTIEEIESLLDTEHVSNEWTTQNGVNGRLFTDKTSGKSIFLPAAGYRCGISNGALKDIGTTGFYWSSTQQFGNGAHILGLESSKSITFGEVRRSGSCVRPVLE